MMYKYNLKKQLIQENQSEANPKQKAKQYSPPKLNKITKEQKAELHLFPIKKSKTLERSQTTTSLTISDKQSTKRKEHSRRASTLEVRSQKKPLFERQPTYFSFEIREDQNEEFKKKFLRRILFHIVILNNFFFGAAAWQFTAHLVDEKIGYKYRDEEFILIWYFYRCISVGFFDSIFCCLGGLVAYKFEKWYTKKKMTNNDWWDIWKLQLSAFIVGVLWQPETDIANFLADSNNGFRINDTIHSKEEIIMNFVMFVFFHSFIFAVISRYFRATWATFSIDFQVGFGAFGFYFSSKFSGENYLLNAINAGFWTFLFASIASIVYYGYQFYKWKLKVAIIKLKRKYFMKKKLIHKENIQYLPQVDSVDDDEDLDVTQLEKQNQGHFKVWTGKA